jgi:hypothetical protein
VSPRSQAELMTRSIDPTKGDERDRAIARLEKALSEALERTEAAESMLDDQRARLQSLGQGREETMRALAETRDALRRVGIERDELRKQLTRVDGMQTATIALPEDDGGLAPAAADVPSLDDLMRALGSIEEPHAGDGPLVAGHLHQHVQRAYEEDGSVEMISPQLVFPEKFAETAKTGEHIVAASVTRVLVLLDPEKPIKYPLYQESMTIGRAESADIHINNGFLSRLHARVISTPTSVKIEDYESKNGIRVNGKITQSQPLKHGDIVDLGRLRFRFLDTATDDGE